MVLIGQNIGDGDDLIERGRTMHATTLHELTDRKRELLTLIYINMNY